MSIIKLQTSQSKIYLTAKIAGEAEEDMEVHSPFKNDGWIIIGRCLLLLLEYNSRTTGTSESVSMYLFLYGNAGLTWISLMEKRL